MTRENIKSIIKKLKYKKIENKSGVALYKWNEPFRFEKIFDFYKQPELGQDGLLSPNGICMNENLLFISDKDYKALYKVDLKTGDVLQKLSLTESEPIGIALCSDCLFIIDSRNQEITSIDIDKLKMKKSVKIAEDFHSYGGYYDMVIQQNNYLFVKSRSDTRVLIYDLNLNFKNCFEYDGANFQGLSWFKISDQEGANEMLVIGKNVDNKFFKIGYFDDF